MDNLTMIEEHEKKLQERPLQAQQTQPAPRVNHFTEEGLARSRQLKEKLDEIVEKAPKYDHIRA